MAKTLNSKQLPMYDECCLLYYLFFKWTNPGIFFVYFWSFLTNNSIFTTNQCEKMSFPSSIGCRDSNPRLLEHQCSPITTRPGLPSLSTLFSLYHDLGDEVAPTYMSCQRKHSESLAKQKGFI